jgi:DNA-directed RNA polymerase specialized sigma24 family protein
VAALSEQQRLVLLGKCVDGMTFSQVAAGLSIAVPTAKTHYLRALEAVRRRLAARIAVEHKR